MRVPSLHPLGPRRCQLTDGRELGQRIDRGRGGSVFSTAPVCCGVGGGGGAQRGRTARIGDVKLAEDNQTHSEPARGE